MLRTKSPLNIAIAVVGAALLAVTVRRVGGWGAVIAGIAGIGWWFALVVLLGAARMAARARAWMLCAHDAELSFPRAFAAVLAGDAAGNLTPLGVFASEPTKVLMTRLHISTVTSIASVAIENVFYVVSVALVLLAGTWMFLQRADVPPGLEQLSEAILMAVALAGLVTAWAARTQPAVLSRIVPLFTRLARRSAAPAGAVEDVERRIYGALEWPLARLLHVAAWEGVFHILAVAEVWMVLRLLAGGEGVTLVDAFLMESAGRFVTVAFKFVPYRLGIDEVGSAAVSTALGLAATVGVTLALVRRLRIVVLNAVGVVLLARR